MTFGAGETRQAPSGDEPILAERATPLTPSPPFDSIHNGAGPNQVASMDVAVPNAQRPIRRDPPVDGLSILGARTSRGGDNSPGGDFLDHFGPPAWKGETVLLGVAQREMEQAVRCPLVRWPDFAQSFPDRCGVPLSHLIFNLEHPATWPVLVRSHHKPGPDSISLVLAGAGPVLADQKDFCLINEVGRHEFHLAIAHFPVYKLAERQVRTHQNVHNQLGIRLGPSSSGVATHYLRELKCMSSALRKSSLGEVLGFLGARGLFGPTPLHAR